MRITVLFRMIVWGVMAFAGITSANLKAQSKDNFFTNEEKVGDLVMSKVIYKMDGSLYR